MSSMLARPIPLDVGSPATTLRPVAVGALHPSTAVTLAAAATWPQLAIAALVGTVIGSIWPLTATLTAATVLTATRWGQISELTDEHDHVLHSHLHQAAAALGGRLWLADPLIRTLRETGTCQQRHVDISDAVRRARRHTPTFSPYTAVGNQIRLGGVFISVTIAIGAFWATAGILVSLWLTGNVLTGALTGSIAATLAGAVIATMWRYEILNQQLNVTVGATGVAVLLAYGLPHRIMSVPRKLAEHAARRGRYLPNH